LPAKTYQALMEGIENTRHNTRMTLILALNYSAKWEILHAVRELSHRAYMHQINPDDINEQIFSSALTTAGIPDPELMIRTSGERRISNFLLWQIAYAELYFTDVFWPDFDKQEFL
jgi:undecaprenyl diphosphate synthase